LWANRRVLGVQCSFNLICQVDARKLGKGTIAWIVQVAFNVRGCGLQRTRHGRFGRLDCADP
jgi:hypothetical protein